MNDVKKFDMRTRRMRKLILLNAPREILGEEARLMVWALDGGRGRHIRMEILSLAARHWRFYVGDPFSRLLCRLNLHHPGKKDEDGAGCLWCQRGATAEFCKEEGEDG